MNRLTRVYDNTMAKLRFQEKYTLNEIGEMYGISGERVRQLTSPSNGKRNRTRKNMALDNKRTQIVMSHPELTSVELVAKFHIPANVVRQLRRNFKLTAGNSNIAKGNRAELEVSKRLTNAGIEHEMMPNKAPFDIQLKNGLRVDVKSSSGPIHPASQSTPFYPFGLDRGRNRGNYADVFALYLSDTDDVYFIPASATNRQWVRIPAISDEFRLRPHSSKFDQYKNNLDCLWVQRQKGS